MERKRRLSLGVRIAIGVVLGFSLLLLVADFVTSSPAVCRSCHEIEPRADAWDHSAHAEVECVKCHVAPYEWYQLPQAVFARASLLARDISIHMSGDYQDPVEERSAGVPPMKDEVCLQCHDVNRQATSGFRILIDHPEHAKRNGSCVSCHVRTAHPVETRGKAITFMAQCFTCHGTGASAKAPATCTLCHPSDYELVPASHKNAKWETSTHAKTAKADPKQCELCHRKAFCTNCHGLDMPHPTDWAKKGATGHAQVAETNRTVCTRCHGSRQDMCTMCHHQGYDPTRGTWVKQHFLEVEKRGADFCMKCHAPVFCVRCHVSTAMQQE